MYIKIKSLAAAYKFNQNFCGKQKLRSKNTKNKNQLIKSNRSKIALRGDSYHVRLIRQKKKNCICYTRPRYCNLFNKNIVMKKGANMWYFERYFSK